MYFGVRKVKGCCFEFFQKYQKQLQTFRNQLNKSPKGKHRSDGSEFEMTRDKVRSSNERYSNLKASCDALMDRLQTARDRQRDFDDNMYRTQTELMSTEARARDMKAEPTAVEPHQVQEQLERVKAFRSEAFNQTKNLDDLRKSAKSLVEAMTELGADDNTIRHINDLVKSLERDHADLMDAMTAKSNTLQTALVQSQGIQEGIDGLLVWLREAEGTLNSMKPISLSEDSLNDQAKDYQVLQADVETHEPSVKSVNRSGATMSDPEMASAVYQKLQDLNNRFDTVAERCKERGDDIRSISKKLKDFNESATGLHQWITPMLETLESKETAHLDTPLFKQKLSEITSESRDKEDELERLRHLAGSLIQSPKTGDVSKVRDTLEKLEQNWQDLEDTLSDKRKEAGMREEQSSRFEDMKDSVLRWLTYVENRLDDLEPVAIDVEIIEKQIEEIEVSSMLH